ncbi:hypothetical protein [Fodinicola acaciae]|uniref:hypothetical protein n=1 Tax=Fodinicola acaciae TaxID=2681555 RepID=UPI0013D74C84|nr:hypothetical protein [Fodinicola acaciae]
METDALNTLRLADPASRRSGLLAMRPPNAGANWWLGVIQHVTLRATGPAMPDAHRRSWAELSMNALEAALETGALDAQEVATRQAWLCRSLAADDRPPSLRPDSAARRCLSLVGMSPAEVAATRWSLRVKDAPKIRKLRRIRILVVAAVGLAPQIEDDELLHELAEWREIAPTLP